MAMNNQMKSSLAFAAMTLAAIFATSASAADLGGSLKESYVAPLPRVHATAGSCYFRADVGYSVSSDPSVRWGVFNEVFQGDDNTNRVIDADEISYRFAGDNVQQVSMDNTWLAEVGAGCGSGPRSLRADVLFGFRGDRDITGVPPIYNGTLVGEPVGTPGQDIDDPLHTSLKSYTLMFNAYYDIGKFRGFVPYVGAGVGAAYHIVDEVYFTENPNLINRIEGDETLSFAWSLMAGLAYQVSDRAILDFGYRYINMGDAKSGRVDNAGFVNPQVDLDDIAAHEFKIGLRYHFGQSSSCCEYAGLK